MSKSQTHSDIAKIKIAMKQLGVPDDDGDPAHGILSTYRSMLKKLTGKTSVASRVMSTRDRRIVLKHFHSLGFKPRRTSPGTSRRKAKGMASDGQIGLMRHLWKRLGTSGALEAGTDASIDSWVSNRTRKYNSGAGYDSVDFLPKKMASILIEELKQWCARLGVVWR